MKLRQNIMKKRITLLSFLLLLGIVTTNINAQTTSTSYNLVAQPIPDRSISYNVLDTGVSKPIIWGLDLAWLSEDNIRRGVNFMGVNRVDIVRSSFTPTDSLVNGGLKAAELAKLNQRINIINNRLRSNINIVLNCDHPSVHSWFSNNPAGWAQLIDTTASLHEEQGHTIVTVSPFNEPDYSATGQGNISDFYNIAGELKNNPHFDNVRISGGNTLNCDQAMPWYYYLKDRLDEGNTHQLAGSFDNYADFYKSVRLDDNHATNDELHNVMEAMVGVEYGMQTGIWWGTAEFARGEFVKASDGKRLGYAEHRDNWTAASVYRGTGGKVQAFGGTSERQATTTTYRFFSKDRAVFYDGYGPQHEYTMVMPGGTDYQTGQTNAERVVNITWGDDIQPVIDGKYILVNRASGKVMEVANGSLNNGANVQQGTNTGATYQQWNVTPVDSRIGGDFSYFTIMNVNSVKSLDILNFSLDNGGNISMYGDSKSANQQWYLEYASDGWFFIRSRWSSYCLNVAGANTNDGANIEQYEKRGGTSQQWRFLPVGAEVEFDAPSAPSDLVAKANAESIQLDWSASPEADVAGYTIFRSESAGGPYNTIARNVTSTSFLDNSASIAKPYYYVIKAIDNSLNSSDYSLEVNATSTNDSSLVAYYPFEDNLSDSSINLNHGASLGDISFAQGNEGSLSLALNSTDAFVQLPTTIANQEEITIATWVYWKGGPTWQRIFDFGNNNSEYMFLTTSSASGKLRFAIKNGAEEQTLNAPVLSQNVWAHVAVTLNKDDARLYVNGVVVDSSDAFTILPIDFKPVLNYIGRSQFFTDPLFNGRIDDFKIFNYALSAEEVAQVYEPVIPPQPNSLDNIKKHDNTLSLWPVPTNDFLLISYPTEKNISSKLSVFDMNGNLVISENANLTNVKELNVSKLPTGIYVLKISNREETIMKKFMVK
jgi:hypothetical protein